MVQRLTLYDSTPAAGSATTTGATLAGNYNAEFATAVLALAVPATDVGDTLDVFVDTSVDGGTNWVNVIHFAQLLGNGGAKQFAATIAPQGNVATAPTDVSADGAAGSLRHFLGDTWRVRLVQVDANTNAAFPISVKLYLAPGVGR